MMVLVGLVIAEGACETGIREDEAFGAGDVRLPKSTQFSISVGSTYCLLGAWKLMAEKCAVAIEYSPVE
jgi:hypothetical protein